MKLLQALLILVFAALAVNATASSMASTSTDVSFDDEDDGEDLTVDDVEDIEDEDTPGGVSLHPNAFRIRLRRIRIRLFRRRRVAPPVVPPVVTPPVTTRRRRWFGRLFRRRRRVPVPLSQPTIMSAVWSKFPDFRHAAPLMGAILKGRVFIRADVTLKGTKAAFDTAAASHVKFWFNRAGSESGTPTTIEQHQPYTFLVGNRPLDTYTKADGRWGIAARAFGSGLAASHLQRWFFTISNGKTSGINNFSAGCEKRFPGNVQKKCPNSARIVARLPQHNCRWASCITPGTCPGAHMRCANGQYVERDPNNACQYTPCSTSPPPQKCSPEARTCEGGIIMFRDPYKQCQYFPCPGSEGGNTVNGKCRIDIQMCASGLSFRRNPTKNCEFPSCTTAKASESKQAIEQAAAAGPATNAEPQQQQGAVNQQAQGSVVTAATSTSPTVFRAADKPATCGASGGDGSSCGTAGCPSDSSCCQAQCYANDEAKKNIPMVAIIIGVAVIVLIIIFAMAFCAQNKSGSSQGGMMNYGGFNSNPMIGMGGTNSYHL